MQITKKFAEKWQQKVHEKEPIKKDQIKNISDIFICRLMKQGKQLSQIIAKSWMEDEVAQELRKYFICPDNHQAPDGYLKELLGNKGDGKAGELLLKIFQEYELPIFDEYELTEVYSFSISWDTWEGSVNDVKQLQVEQGKHYLHIILPYPPRPQLGEATFTLAQLQAWVAQDVTDRNGKLLIDNDHQVYPPYPYIPLTSC